MKSPLSRTFGTVDTPQAEFELYETPKEAILQLLESQVLRPPVWEPACGKEAISRYLRDAGYDTISTDLNNYGEGLYTSGIDFLKQTQMRGGARTIITNPPYEFALEFCQQAVNLIKEKKGNQAFMLIRLDFLSSKGRKDFLTHSPLKKVLVFSGRLGFMTPNSVKPRKGVNYAWFVWEAGHVGPPTIGWL